MIRRVGGEGGGVRRNVVMVTRRVGGDTVGRGVAA